jgi:hypothetical protein
MAFATDTNELFIQGNSSLVNLSQISVTGSDLTMSGTTGTAITNATLTATGVTAGTYGNGTNIPQITVDSKGRITNVTTVAASGSGGSSSISVTGTDLTLSGTTGVDITNATLTATGVTAGTYNNSATQITPITVDAKGRITATGTAVTITPAWSSITSKPTTLAGYGITDGAPINNPTFTGTVTIPTLSVTGNTSLTGSVTASNNTIITGILTLFHSLENITVSATAASGTINYYWLNQDILYYTSAATGNWTLNITGNSTTTLNSLMSIGQTVTLVYINTTGTTAYYQTGLQIDGTAVTPKWYGGATPTSGNASSLDVYSITIIKTANATYTVLETQTTFK